jgi:hypothetical protein
MVGSPRAPEDGGVARNNCVMRPLLQGCRQGGKPLRTGRVPTLHVSALAPGRGSHISLLSRRAPRVEHTRGKERP